MHFLRTTPCGMGKLWHGGLGFPSHWTATGGRERGGDEDIEK